VGIMIDEVALANFLCVLPFALSIFIQTVYRHSLFVPGPTECIVSIPIASLNNELN
jgi:hypothetical protein